MMELVDLCQFFQIEQSIRYCTDQKFSLSAPKIWPCNALAVTAEALYIVIEYH